ncbi:hypothetical protein Bca4012_018526 [Brassica carinata]
MGNMCGKLKYGNSTSKCSARDRSMFRYDPSSYSLNFDDERRENSVEVNVSGGFSSRISTPESKILQER